MHDFGLSEKAVYLIKDTFKLFPGITEAIMFGSRAMGNYKKGSDVDIALKGKIDFTLLAKINALLNEELPLPYFFDLVAYDDIDNEELKQHIDEHGRVFYTR